jgi:hypothetical protein
MEAAMTSTLYRASTPPQPHKLYDDRALQLQLVLGYKLVLLPLTITIQSISNPNFRKQDQQQTPKMSSTVAGIPENTTQADPKAVQEVSGGHSAPSTTESHGPAVSTNYNNVERTSGSESTGSSGPKGVKGIAAAVHGAGEKIRGKFNGGVDDAFNEVSSNSGTVMKSGEL